MVGLKSIHVTSKLWIVAAFVCGTVSTGLWFVSEENWRNHLDHAYWRGSHLFRSDFDSSKNPLFSISDLSAEDSDKAERGAFAQISGMPQPAYATVLTFRDELGPVTTRSLIRLGVVSDKLRYPVADLSSTADLVPSQKMASLSRLLATYCSDAVIFAESRSSRWISVSAPELWSCDATPPDLRLGAAVLSVFCLIGLWSSSTEVSSKFRSFAAALKARRRFGSSPQSYPAKGPSELQELVSAINGYLEEERAILAERATMLSGVSHDLGTPATRLRLRVALIEDSRIREQLQGDIDQMTGMIETVLTYTRSELNLEEPCTLSLAALTTAIVSDYQDVGLPVDMEQNSTILLKSGHSVFLFREHTSSLTDYRQIVVSARPVSLKRAISNLIENAVKYGHRAKISLQANSAEAFVIVEDEGRIVNAETVNSLVAPFRRGDNAASVKGFGMGLTIAATVASQHGGSLRFENAERGLRAILTIQRTY